MLGWEFPPHISGGLGSACQGLTDAMTRKHARVLFVLPRAIGTPGYDASASYGEGTLRVAPVPSELTSPYPGSGLAVEAFAETVPHEAGDPASVRMVSLGSGGGYGGDLAEKVRRYSERCVRLSRRELFDVIHAHDWMTFPAGEAIARFSGRPLIAHVHATEFDRSGACVDPTILSIESRALRAATRVIAVSHRTRRTIVRRYGVPAGRIEVIHNGIDVGPTTSRPPSAEGKRVLFLGRVTRQKGPEYFVRAAARVARRRADVRFVVAGTGDLIPRVTDLARELGVENRFEFTGFLSGAEVEKTYRSADVFVMPSVSEPFGLTALEAVRCGVPVVMSKSAGVGEVLRRGAIKVDCRDSERMADTILGILDNPDLAERLRRRGAEEIRGLTWDTAAGRCLRLYNELAVNGGWPYVPARSDAVGVSPPTQPVAARTRRKDSMLS